MAVSGTQRRATGRKGTRNVLEYHAPEVVAILATGEQPVEVARLYGVERSSVTRFVERHSEAIDAMRVEVVKAVTDYHIAHKVNRIGILDKLAGLMVAEVDANGIMQTEREYGKDGQVEYETRVLQDKLIREIRGVLKDAADELGQIPKSAPEVNVNVGLLVRYVEGG